MSPRTPQPQPWKSLVFSFLRNQRPRAKVACPQGSTQEVSKGKPRSLQIRHLPPKQVCPRACCLVFSPHDRQAGPVSSRTRLSEAPSPTHCRGAGLPPRGAEGRGESTSGSGPPWIGLREAHMAPSVPKSSLQCSCSWCVTTHLATQVHWESNSSQVRAGAASGNLVTV